MTGHKQVWLLLAGAVVAAAALAGCLSRDLAPVDPKTQSGVFVEISQTGTTKVDMLFVVDNSNSMHEEQKVLTEQIRHLAEELINPEPPADGQPPPSFEDLHIGVVTSDMGTGGYTIMTCSNPMVGDNGELKAQGRREGCDETYSASDCDRASCPWLVHQEGMVSETPIWDQFSCIATLGTGGCGFEQQLAASSAALTIQAQPGAPNDGFLRDDSLIAIIYVTDEDDCSVDDDEMFNPSRADLGPLNVRCAVQDEQRTGRLVDVAEYYNTFTGLRPGNEDLVVVAAITGVPVDGSWNPGDPIDSLRSLRQINPNNPNELLPSCETPMGFAFPPVRIAELVYMFGTNGILESICRSDWTQALEAITRKIQSKLTGACMSRTLESTDPDVCRVIETLNPPAGGTGAPTWTR